MLNYFIGAFRLTQTYFTLWILLYWGLIKLLWWGSLGSIDCTFTCLFILIYYLEIKPFILVWIDNTTESTHQQTSVRKQTMVHRSKWSFNTFITHFSNVTFSYGTLFSFIQSCSSYNNCTFKFYFNLDMCYMQSLNNQSHLLAIFL